MDQEFIELVVEGVQLRLAVTRRGGTKPPILFLHGFGSTKEDYTDIIGQREFDDHAVILYDAPGCGDSECRDLAAVTIPFLRTTAEAVLAHYGIGRFHLVGHSMGGLTALLLAHHRQSDLLSFTSIEGNLAPEDCFLSRQLIDSPESNPQAFMAALGKHVMHGDDPARERYVNSLQHNVRAGAVEAIFRSMVDLSDHGDLMQKFLGLRPPQMFMYGAQNSGLTYLSALRRQGVRLAEIPHSGHFLMYSCPTEMWRQLAGFIADVEEGL